MTTHTSQLAPVILIVANDYLTAETMEYIFSPRLKSYRFEMIYTEHGFREMLESNEPLPAAIVMSARFKWSEAIPEIPEPPPEVAEQGHYRRAGYRCVELMRSNPRWASVPVLLETLESTELVGEKGPTDFWTHNDWDEEWVEKLQKLLEKK